MFAKTKTFFLLVISLWDAYLYIKVVDGIYIYIYSMQDNALSVIFTFGKNAFTFRKAIVNLIMKNPRLF